MPEQPSWVIQKVNIGTANCLIYVVHLDGSQSLHRGSTSQCARLVSSTMTEQPSWLIQKVNIGTAFDRFTLSIWMEAKACIEVPHLSVQD